MPLFRDYYNSTDEAYILVSGGVPPYNITLNGTTVTTSNSYTWTGISAGSQTFEIVDNNGNGCMVDTTIVFTEPPAITASVIIDTIFCQGNCDGSITAIISGGVGGGVATEYTYQWYDGTGTTGPPIGTSYTINNLCAGDYTLEVTDFNDCSQIFTWQIVSSASALLRLHHPFIGALDLVAPMQEGYSGPMGLPATCFEWLNVFFSRQVKFLQ